MESILRELELIANAGETMWRICLKTDYLVMLCHVTMKKALSHRFDTSVYRKIEKIKLVDILGNEGTG